MRSKADESTSNKNWHSTAFPAALKLPSVCRLNNVFDPHTHVAIGRSDDQLIPLREGLERSRSSLLYGVTTGTALADVIPFHGTASRFLLEVGAIVFKCFVLFSAEYDPD